MFRASAEIFKQQGAEGPAAAEITQQLKLITNWVSMHNQLLEQLESQDYFGYEQFTRSNAYAGVLAQVLGLTIVDGAETLISFSGFQALDKELNIIKTRVLEMLIKILEYIFDRMNSDQKSAIPYIVKMNGLIPLLIKTCHQFATSATLHTMLLDENVKEFITQCLEILIILAGE